MQCSALSALPVWPEESALPPHGEACTQVFGRPGRPADLRVSELSFDGPGLPLSERESLFARGGDPHEPCSGGCKALVTAWAADSLLYWVTNRSLAWEADGCAALVLFEGTGPSRGMHRCQAPARVHDGYVWQRDWNAEVRAGVGAAHPVFASLRVNAVSIGGEGTLVHDVALDSLVGSPISMVARVDATGPVDAEGLRDVLVPLITRWRAAGVDVARVEVDHDCATAELPAYASAIARLRRQLPDDVRLSVTALPTWSSSDALVELLSAADEAVLQVHTVDAEEGLFDARAARVAVDHYLARTHHPLWVAVPAYGMAYGGQELRADPAAVTAFVRSIDKEIAGIVWFRVPTGDPRDWPLAAIRGAIWGQVPVGTLALRAAPGPNGAFDVSASNNGLAWVALPSRVEVGGDCTASDGVGGYRVDRSRGLAFARDDRLPLDPGVSRAVGWVRCAEAPLLMGSAP